MYHRCYIRVCDLRWCWWPHSHTKRTWWPHVTSFLYKVPCITGDTFDCVMYGDPYDLIVNRGEPGDLRWLVSYRKYHVSTVINSVVWSQVILVTSLWTKENLVTSG